jgi:hypothetical protein
MEPKATPGLIFRGDLQQRRSELINPLIHGNKNQSSPAIHLNQRHKNHLYSQPTPYRYWLKQAFANFNFGWFSLAEAIQECLR